jgi:hypothetical protein
MIPDKLLKHKKCAGLHLNQELKTIFQRHYPNSTDTPSAASGNYGV